MSRLRLALTTLATLPVVWMIATPVAAGELALICPLVLEQERIEIEDQRLQVDYADAHLNAVEQILGLVASLHDDDAIEEIVYLRYRHERDVAKVEVQRQRLLLKRIEATLEQYEAVCAPGSEGEPARGERRKAALRRYRQIECHRVGKDLAIAELDLAFFTEVLESVQRLRAGRVASGLDVIDAQWDVDGSQIRVDHGRRRVDACTAPGVAAGAG